MMLFLTHKPHKIFSTLIFLISSGCIFSTVANAENMLVDANILYTIPDAGGSDNFHTGKILSLNYNYYALPWLAVTSGLFLSEEIADNPSTDIVGTFQARIETSGFTVGLRPEYAFSKRNKIYGRAGILVYKTKLTVDEYFAPGLISGSTSDTANGNGFIIALGWAHSFTQKVSLQIELKTQQQLDLFDGKTSADNVFDISYSGFSLGLGYAF